MLCWIACVAAVLAAMLLAARPAAARRVVNVELPVWQFLENPCFSTNVMFLSGDVHMVMSDTAEPGGGHQFVVQLDQKVSGTTITTGRRYIADETYTSAFSTQPPYPVVHTFEDTLTLISQGSTDNWPIRTRVHITVTADGVPTAAVDDFTSERAA